MYADDEFVCPHCGEELPTRAQFCRHCGSDLETGWSEFADYPGLDLPDESEDEFEERAAAAPPSRWQQVVVVTAVLLLIWIVLFWLWP